jgi:hypothetical protein
MEVPFLDLVISLHLNANYRFASVDHFLMRVIYNIA